jgi:hypothetical protein
MPVPLTLSFWGLPGALSEISTAFLNIPAVEGLKLTLIVQLAPGASVDLQFVALMNVPIGEIRVMFRVALPVLVSVEVWGTESVPANWLPNVREDGASVTAGPCANATEAVNTKTTLRKAAEARFPAVPAARG